MRVRLSRRQAVTLGIFMTLTVLGGGVAGATTTPSNSATTAVSAPVKSNPSNVVFADRVAEFNVLCGVDHFAADDPIMFPGRPGASHEHAFYGNNSTSAASTVSSLSAASRSSCGREMKTSDLSAYWVPVLMKKNADGTSSVVKSGEQFNVVYYRRPGGGMGPGVQPFPVGLRMIAGDSKATSDQARSAVTVAWSCDGGGGAPHMPAAGCAGTSPSTTLVATLIFPSCWDGVHLDSADHKQHMAYAAANGTCPADHPVSLPELTFDVRFPGITGGPDYYLASGGIYSWHGDFIADWNNQVQNALVASCLNVPHSCHNINRNGKTLQASNGSDSVTVDLSKFPDTSPYANQNLQGPAPSPTGSTSCGGTPGTSTPPMDMPMHH